MKKIKNEQKNDILSYLDFATLIIVSYGALYFITYFSEIRFLKYFNIPADILKINNELILNLLSQIFTTAYLLIITIFALKFCCMKKLTDTQILQILLILFVFNFVGLFMAKKNTLDITLILLFNVIFLAILFSPYNVNYNKINKFKKYIQLVRKKLRIPKNIEGKLIFVITVFFIIFILFAVKLNNACSNLFNPYDSIYKTFKVQVIGNYIYDKKQYIDCIIRKYDDYFVVKALCISPNCDTLFNDSYKILKQSENINILYITSLNEIENDTKHFSKLINPKRE